MQVGMVVPCPHCSLETLLYVPQVPLAPRRQAGGGPGPAAEQPKGREVERKKSEAPSRFYFYKTKDGEKGPYTDGQLRSLWANGHVTADVVYRSEGSAEWMPLCDSPILKAGQLGLGQVAGRIPPLRTVQQWMFRAICLLSVISFFLANVCISVPIVGKIDLSMLSFLALQSQSPSADQGIPRPDFTFSAPITALFGSDGALRCKAANAGPMICAAALLGLLLHYLLTLVCAALTFGFKRSSPLTRGWLVLAIQFPILYSVGARLILAGATSETMNELNDNLFGVPGVADAHNVSLAPGLVMWVLMFLCVAALGLPLVARKMGLAWEAGETRGSLGAGPGSAGERGWKAMVGGCWQGMSGGMGREVQLVGGAALAFGVISCVICWAPGLGRAAVAIALLGIVLAIALSLFAIVKTKRGFGVVVGIDAACVLALVIAAGAERGTVVIRTPGEGAAGRKSEGAGSGGRAAATAPVARGGVVVAVGGASIGSVCYRDVVGRPQFTQPYLIVTLCVSNASSTRKVGFQTWRGAAALTDDHHNNYKRINVTPASNLLDADPDSASIHPRRVHVDRVVFERPVENIKWLRVELPARNYGGSGMLRFEIPANRIRQRGE